MVFFTKLLPIFAVLYAAYCAVLFMLQRQIVFPRYVIETPPAPDFPAFGIERIWIEIPEGRIEVWYLPPKSGGALPAPVVIMAHGNAELIDSGPAEFSRFTRMGYGVCFIEYPGYGRSEGKPSQKSITEAFVAAYDRLTGRKDVDPSRVLLYGRSLGGGAVCQLAARRKTGGMILQSTFTSTRSFAKRYLAPGLLMRDPFDNLAVVRDYDNPVLVIHGTYDEVIPYRHGVALARTAPNAKLITYACGHNDCPPDADRFWADIEAFLKHESLLPKSDFEVTTP